MIVLEKSESEASQPLDADSARFNGISWEDLHYSPYLNIY